MNFYLNKYGYLPPQLTEPVSDNTGIIIVIPCFNESDLISSLTSIAECDSPSCDMEIIVVVNNSENELNSIIEQNNLTSSEINEWVSNYTGPFSFLQIQALDLPQKHAGVGLARKIGMDEAVARFESINTDGVIVCFDADSKCTANYLTEIESHFKVNTKSPGCSIHYEHPIEGDEFSAEIYEGIINYELHLRYYNQCLKYTGLPYAFHTVGSSMAVKSSAYQKQGGMNKRKAGEDFYFIHKIIALGGFTELKSAMVIPSPRISDRVPFGTGKAIGDWIERGRKDYQTYNFSIFEEIKSFVIMLPELFESPKSTPKVSAIFNEFLLEQQFTERLRGIKKHTTDYKSFRKRFFVWFDAFQVLKLVHFMRDKGYPNQDLLENCNALLRANSIEQNNKNNRDLLHCFREIEKS